MLKAADELRSSSLSLPSTPRRSQKVVGSESAEDDDDDDDDDVLVPPAPPSPLGGGGEEASTNDAEAPALAPAGGPGPRTTRRLRVPPEPGSAGGGADDEADMESRTSFAPAVPARTTTTATAAASNGTTRSTTTTRSSFPLPAMGHHVLLVTGRRRLRRPSPVGTEEDDPHVVEAIVSYLLRSEDEGKDDGEDEGKDDGDEQHRGNSDDTASAGFPSKRAKSSKPKAGAEDGSERGDDDSDECDSEEDDEEEDDESVIRRLAAGRSSRMAPPLPPLRGSPTTTTTTTTSLPMNVHVVETLAEWETNHSLRVEMDHVVVFKRDLDALEPAGDPFVAATPNGRGGGGGGGTTRDTLPASLWHGGLSMEERHVLRRNLMGDWRNRVSKVRVLDRPFGHPRMSAPRHDGGDDYNDDDDENDAIPTFVCLEYDANSVRQVARIVRRRVVVAPR